MWIAGRQRLILHQAEKNLQVHSWIFPTAEKLQKFSLIIFEYENQLIRQKLDTVVT